MRIAQSCNTSSKAKERYPENYPTKIVKGEGAYVFDANGRKYLDFCNSLGPIVLGHHAIDNAVCWVIRSFGNIFSLAHPMEEDLGELLAELIPSAEMSKLFHNGKDATAAAVRLARHITGREKVYSFSYHGADDVFMACGKADKGVPSCLKGTIIDFDYNEVPLVDDQTAAVIMEPHTIRAPEPGYLEEIRSLCDKTGTLLIFDEIVSFPRYPKMSAQSTFGVIPDLTCISKGMANGFAISALCGLEKHMKHIADGEVFASTTFGGNLVGVSASIATLTKCRDEKVHEQLNALGGYFKAGINDNPYVKVVGSINSRLFLECSDENRQKIWQEMIKRGVMFNVPIFFNAAMTIADMDYTTDNLNEVIAKLPEIELVGRKATEIFRKR